MKILVLTMLVITIAAMAHLGGSLAIERNPRRQQPQHDEENLNAKA